MEHDRDQGTIEFANDLYNMATETMWCLEEWRNHALVKISRHITKQVAKELNIVIDKLLEARFSSDCRECRKSSQPMRISKGFWWHKLSEKWCSCPTFWENIEEIKKHIPPLDTNGKVDRVGQ